MEVKTTGRYKTRSGAVVEIYGFAPENNMAEGFIEPSRHMGWWHAETGVYSFGQPNADLDIVSVLTIETPAPARKEDDDDEDSGLDAAAAVELAVDVAEAISGGDSDSSSGDSSSSSSSDDNSSWDGGGGSFDGGGASGDY